jgi:hypothetical protein
MNQVLTDAFQSIIQKEDLIDTGALYASVSADIYQEYGYITISIECEDYVKYHIESRDLIGQFLDLPEVSFEIARLLDEAVMGALGGLFSDEPINLNSFPEDIRVEVNGDFILER